jgi:hypothetical protein
MPCPLNFRSDLNRVFMALSQSSDWTTEYRPKNINAAGRQKALGMHPGRQRQQRAYAHADERSSIHH